MVDPRCCYRDNRCIAQHRSRSLRRNLRNLRMFNLLQSAVRREIVLLRVQLEGSRFTASLKT